MTEVSDHLNDIDRSRSYSGSWHTNRNRAPRIATVKPVSKSFSEDDLLKATRNDVPRVFSRLKIQDLSALKKDSLIGELEKCLEELEMKTDTTQQLSTVYDKVESERNQLLEELDIAFQDLQEYMRRQKTAEDEKAVVEADHEEVLKENEYLKAVLSNRTEIEESKLQEQNRVLRERIKEVEKKNNEFLDEINNLHEERQTLITSLLHLKSDEVDDVIKTKSRSSSLSSLGSIPGSEPGREQLELQLDEMEEGFNKGKIVFEDIRKLMQDYINEIEDTRKALNRVRQERDEAENEIDVLKDEVESLNKTLENKTEDFLKLKEDRNEKNLTISKLNLDKRTLQRQLDRLRETNRSNTIKIAASTKEIDDLVKEVQELKKNNDVQNIRVSKQEFLDQKKEFEKCLECKENEIKEHEAQKAVLVNEMKILQKTNQELMNATNQFEANSEYLISIEKELSFLKDINLNLEKENNSLSQQNFILVQQNKDHHIKIQQISKENIAFKETMKNKEQQYNELQRDYSELEEDLQKLQANSRTMKTEFSVQEKDLQNKISSLEIANAKLESSRNVIEERLQKAESSIRTITSAKEELENALKDQIASVQIERKNSEVNLNNYIMSQEKLVSLERDHDTALKKYQKLEGTVGELSKIIADNKQLTSENKQLKDKREVLHKKSQELEREKSDLMKMKEKEREKYSALLVKYDNLCKVQKPLQSEVNNYVNLCNEYEKLKIRAEKVSKENEVLKVGTDSNRRSASQTEENIELNKELTELRGKYDDVCKKLENVEISLKYLSNERKYLIGEKENLTKEKNNDVELFKDKIKEKENEIIKLKNENDIYKTIPKSHELLQNKEKQIRFLNVTVNELKTNSMTRENKIIELEKKITVLIKDSFTLQSEKEHSHIKSKKLEKENHDLVMQLKTLKEKLDDREKNYQRTEKDYQYILKSHKEEAQANLLNKQIETDQEKHTLKLKYESLRVEQEKLRQEKQKQASVIENLKENVEKLVSENQKLRLCSNSTHDMTIQKLNDENSNLERRNETLENTLKKVNKDNESLLDRINRTDETMATTIRILKARKNELQLQVEKLKHDNQLLRNSKLANIVPLSVPKPDDTSVNSELKEQLVILERENSEYSKKLQESEQLLFELHQALGKANDLAMQKALEMSKSKRNAEKKIEKLTQENTELRRSSLHSSSATSIDQVQTSVKTIQEMRTQLSLDLGDTSQRKVSTPAKFSSQGHSPISPTISGSIKNGYLSYSDQQLRSTSLSQSPGLPEEPSSILTTMRLSQNELSHVGKFRSLNPSANSSSSSHGSGEVVEWSPTPKPEASRQIENDLSQQLKELLELTDSLTPENPKNSNIPEKKRNELSQIIPRNYSLLEEESTVNSKDGGSSQSEHWV